MSRTLIVSRHAGTIEWLARRKVKGEIVAHLGLVVPAEGDCVVGNLPAHIVADLCSRGVNYIHLAIDPLPEDRGNELSADELDARGARLMPLIVLQGVDLARYQRIRRKRATLER